MDYMNRAHIKSPDTAALDALVALYRLSLTQSAFDRALCRSDSAYPSVKTTRSERVGHFYNDKYLNTARNICAQCPIIGDCLAYAMFLDILVSRPKRTAGEFLFGVWGGTSPKERLRLHKTITVGQMIDLMKGSVSKLVALQTAQIYEEVVAVNTDALEERLADLRDDFCDAINARSSRRSRV